MRRFITAIVVSVLGVVLSAQSGYALSSNPKMFISADNTFYIYAKGGETLSATFTRVAEEEVFGTVRGDVNVTVEGPSFTKQSCVLKAAVPVGQGCSFNNLAVPATGIWRITFTVPPTANSYPEVSPTVKWAKNFFKWSISVNKDGVEQKGRIWTEQYAIRQPAPANYAVDFDSYYISENGYIYHAKEKGYNGQISTLSADGIGIRSGKDCTSVYKSTEVSDKKYSPALGACGNGYKLFFEEPAGDLPDKAKRWDGKLDWVRPDIKKPQLSELHFEPDSAQDQQSGTISFFLYNFIGQYEIKIDIDNDGSFDGQSDVTIRAQMKNLSNGLQRIRFDGVDRQGQIIPRGQKIGIKVAITRVAEIHLVAADVEGRTGGLELTRMNGENAPVSDMCWNDTDLNPLTLDSLMPTDLDGRSCPGSTGGVHAWVYNDESWGNARYIDDWAFASVKLTGNDSIVYQQDDEEKAANEGSNALVVGAMLVGILVVVGLVVFVVIKIKKKKNNQIPPQGPPSPPAPPSLTITGQGDNPPGFNGPNGPPPPPPAQ